MVGPTTPPGSGTSKTLARATLEPARSGAFTLTLGFVRTTQLSLKSATAATLELTLHFTPASGPPASFTQSVKLQR